MTRLKAGGFGALWPLSSALEETCARAALARSRFRQATRRAARSRCAGVRRLGCRIRIRTASVMPCSYSAAARPSPRDLPGGAPRRGPELAVLGDRRRDLPQLEPLVEQPLERRDVGARHARPAQAERARRGVGDAAGAGEPAPPLLLQLHHGPGVRGRAVVGDQAAADAAGALDVAGEELDADADVRAGLPAAAELVGSILEEGARELHRADALVAVAGAPALVPPVERLRHVDATLARGEDQTAVAVPVVPEDVGEPGLHLQYGADQRDGDARARGRRDDVVLVAAAVRADRRRDGARRAGGRVAGRPLRARAGGAGRTLGVPGTRRTRPRRRDGPL